LARAEQAKRELARAQRAAAKKRRHQANLRQRASVSDLIDNSVSAS
jgi:hypothetical protein